MFNCRRGLPHPLNSLLTRTQRCRMDGDLYDEFGNYVGPELESDESSEEGEDDDQSLQDEVNLMAAIQ